MLEKMYYESSDGTQRVNFGEKIYLNYNDLRDYEWSYNIANNSAYNFYRESVEKKLPCVIMGETLQETRELRDHMFEVFESDIKKERLGKIWCGDYYLECNVIKSSNKNYLNHRRMDTEFTIVCVDPSWTRITELGVFKPIESSDISSGLNYPYNYSFNYGVDNTVKSVENDSFAPVDFELVIYGYASDPSVTIGDYTYTVHCEVDNRHELHINSREKTILLYDEYGNTENYFRYRDREDYIFQQIESGENSISWNGPFSIGLTLIEKRSEPKWT